jgi:hypothetical protein
MITVTLGSGKGCCTRKVAVTIEEAKTLIEAKFSDVCEFKGAKVFRKRK